MTSRASLAAAAGAGGPCHTAAAAGSQARHTRARAGAGWDRGAAHPNQAQAGAGGPRAFGHTRPEGEQGGCAPEAGMHALPAARGFPNACPCILLHGRPGRNVCGMPAELQEEKRAPLPPSEKRHTGRRIVPEALNASGSSSSSGSGSDSGSDAKVSSGGKAQQQAAYSACADPFTAIELGEADCMLLWRPASAGHTESPHAASNRLSAMCLPPSPCTRPEAGHPEAAEELGRCPHHPHCRRG